MSTARWTIVGGVIIFIGLCWLAAIGFRPLVAPLVTVGILVLLVAAGNLLYGNSSPAARRAQAAKQAAAEAAGQGQETPGGRTRPGSSGDGEGEGHPS